MVEKSGMQVSTNYAVKFHQPNRAGDRFGGTVGWRHAADFTERLVLTCMGVTGIPPREIPGNLGFSENSYSGFLLKLGFK